MKILLLNGSPRGEFSNTLKLAQSFIKGLAKNLEVQTQTVDVSALKICDCKGAFDCWGTTPGKCVFDDDMSRVIAELKEADVVVWSFPLCHYSLPAKLKMLLDRLLPLWLPFQDPSAEFGGRLRRYDISSKRHVLVSTSGFYTCTGNYDSVTAQFDRLLGKGNYAKVFCPQGSILGMSAFHDFAQAKMALAEEAGTEFAFGQIKPETAKKLSQGSLERSVYEKVSDESWGLTKDGVHKAPTDPALTLTELTAARYNKDSYKKKDIVLELHFTDLNRKLQIILGKDGSKVLKDNLSVPTLTIETTVELWKNILDGKANRRDAVYDHRLKVFGNYKVMERWEEIFGPSREKGKGREKKCNLLFMLVPWIITWVTMIIGTRTAAAVGVGLIAFVPLLYTVFRASIYEYISLFLNLEFCLLAALGVMRPDVVTPVSYFFSGLMWGPTAFMKVPISAYYMQNPRGKEAALKDKLFLRTGRIISAGWGILLTLMTIWTFVLPPTIAKILTACGCASMGSFTGIFQGVHPKRWASKK